MRQTISADILFLIPEINNMYLNLIGLGLLGIFLGVLGYYFHFAEPVKTPFRTGLLVAQDTGKTKQNTIENWRCIFTNTGTQTTDHTLYRVKKKNTKFENHV
jgi:hypothetical protein